MVAPHGQTHRWGVYSMYEAPSITEVGAVEDVTLGGSFDVYQIDGTVWWSDPVKTSH